MNPLFLPMLVLERRDLETGLPDDTYAQVSLALATGVGRTGRSVQRHIGFDGSACLKFGLGLLHSSAGAAQFPQSPNMRASVSFEVREFQVALRFDILFRNLVDQFAPNPSLCRPLLH